MTARVQILQLYGAAAVVACLIGLLSETSGLHAALGYPAAILLGLLVLNGKTDQPSWSARDAVTVAVFTMIVVVSYLVGGFAPPLAIAAALAAACAGIAGAIPIRQGWTRWSWPDEIPDWLIASALAAGVSFVGGCLVGVWAGDVDSTSQLLLFGVGAACATFPAALIVVAWTAANPLAVNLEPHRPLAERIGVGAALCLLAVLVFFRADSMFLPTMLAAGVAWVAVRLSYVDVMLAISSVASISVVASLMGHGPFPANPPSTAAGANTSAVDLLLLHEFMTVTTLIAMFISLSVQGRRSSQRRAESERTNLVDLANASQSVAMAGLDTTGRITMFNPGAERLFGSSIDTAAGTELAEFLDPVEVWDRARIVGVKTGQAEPSDATFVGLCAAICASAETQRHSGDWDWTIHATDGEIRVATIDFSALRDENGTASGYLCTAVDVTSRANAEESFRRALAAERDAEERLRAVDRAKDTFVATVSHELRTPITNILGYAELLEAGDLGALTPSQSQALSRMVSNSERLLSLVTDLLTLNQVQSDQIQLHRRSLSVHALVRRAEASVAHALRDRHLSLQVSLPPKALMVFGDPERLHQVLVALLSNAIKFTGPGGRVGISVGQLHDGVVLAVSDTGTGIPIDEQGQVFESFYRRAETVHAHTPGTGLGLSIARSIVELHGGTVRAVSSPGEGSVFTVTLPVSLSHDGAPRLVVDAPQPRRSA